MPRGGVKSKRLGGGTFAIGKLPRLWLRYTFARGIGMCAGFVALKQMLHGSKGMEAKWTPTRSIEEPPGIAFAAEC